VDRTRAVALVSESWRLQLPRWDLPDGRGRREVWDVLHANSRGGRQHGRRARITREVVHATTVLARAAGTHPVEHLAVELVWAPERANRRRDADNLWPLLKVLCDAVARGPAKRASHAPGLDLVPDDTPEFMTKRAPRIAEPGTHAFGLWLYLIAGA
jgi:hypothetical protein